MCTVQWVLVCFARHISFDLLLQVYACGECSICICVGTSVCGGSVGALCARACVCSRVCQRTTLTVVSQEYHPPCFETGLDSHWSGAHQSCQTSWPPNARDLTVPASPVLGLQICPTKSNILHEFWGLNWNSGLHAHEASTLPTELSSQPPSTVWLPLT